MGNFRDVLIDEAANATLTEFAIRKIAERVKDPVLADKLTPKNHGFGTRRVPLESGYYEVYNQANVELVDINETPIVEITESGIETSDRAREFDMIVYATGFDAITGSFDRIDIRGRDGVKLKDKWASGPRTYLGLQVAGFPNMLTLVGPHNAATFCNIPRCIEQNVDWVSDLMGHMIQTGRKRIEAEPAAEDEWTEHVFQVSSRLLIAKTNSWMTGINSNIAGKDRRVFLAYGGGALRYREKCDAVAAAGYEGFLFT